jgi:uncharacterized membrane protein YgcG
MVPIILPLRQLTQRAVPTLRLTLVRQLPLHCGPMVSFGKLICAFLLYVTAILPVSAVHARTLSWDALDAQARLDADGRLRVVERHTMLFDGDWNGGERSFAPAAGQRFEFIGLSELANGQARPLVAGNLSAVGEYRLDGYRLRWRARAANDPPFRNARREYRIEYQLSGVVSRDYVLNHDFAFADRPGEIRHVTATLTLDPAWQSADTLSLQRNNLPPGQGAVLTAQLQYVGAGTPQALALPAEQLTTEQAQETKHFVLWLPDPEWWRFALLLAVVAFALARVMAWYRHEQRAGRFVPLPSVQVDADWLAANVFKHAPEVVGAAWDLNTSSNEVAAVLARLTQQGKLSSRVVVGSGAWIFRTQSLHMTLLCPRSELQGYERQLIDALFVDGDTTSSEKVARHYRNKGFDPVSLIAPALEKSVQPLVNAKLPLPKAKIFLTAALFATAVPLLIAASIQAAHGWPAMSLAAVPLLGLLVMGRVAATGYRRDVDNLQSAARGTLQHVVLAVVWLGAVLLVGVFSFSVWLPVGCALLAAGVANSICNGMYRRETPASLQFRRVLAVARNHFKRQLKSPMPKLDDAWFPYVMAFGLGADVDRWFKVNATGNSVRTASMTHTGAGGSQAWSGGGGAFGGGGASGSWAAAVGGIASSVPSASSRSSSSSSGGSSGGGSGGGW